MTARRSLLALAPSLVCLLAVAGPVGAATPRGVAEFKAPLCERTALAPAAAEGVLVPLCRKTADGRVVGSLGTLPPSGKMRTRSLPRAADGPFAAGPAGEIWAGTGFEGATLSLIRIAADGTVAKFPLGTAEEGNALEMYGLVPDGEGGAWVAIGELAPDWYFHPYISLGGELLHVAAAGTVARFPVPESVEPQALVRGPDGNLWFAGESGRYSTEHTSYLGKGYVGRMTPAGEFTLFPTATEQSAPGGIAVGTDGRLWFTETAYGVREVGSIGTDGSFGPSLKTGFLQGPLAFGPEGDVWVTGLGGVTRITPSGQHTVFPVEEPRGVVAGAEGDIWTRGFRTVERIVPGAPGIDARSVEADRRSKALHVQLACGGSKRGCEGTLVLSLAGARGTEPGAFLAKSPYSVAAESQRGLTLHLSAKAFAHAGTVAPKHGGSVPTVVHATVAGGPTLDRRYYVPGFVKVSRR